MGIHMGNSGRTSFKEFSPVPGGPITQSRRGATGPVRSKEWKPWSSSLVEGKQLWSSYEQIEVKKSPAFGDLLGGWPPGKDGIISRLPDKRSCAWARGR